MMRNLKLGVEVISAHDLVPRDRSNSCSFFVELHFDRQRFRTSTKDNDPSPVWNERFYFDVSDPDKVSDLPLEAHVYDRAKSTGSNSLVGKVRITGTSFVPYSEALSLRYPLDKRGLLSRARGELRLKVLLTDNPSIMSSNPLPAMDSAQRQAQTSGDAPGMFSKVKKKKTTHTFHDIPKQQESLKSESPPPSASPEKPNFSAQEMKYAPPQPAGTFRNVEAGFASQMQEFSVKETSPVLGAGQVVGGRVLRRERPASTYDLVEPMKFLFVRVVKARELPSMDLTGSLDPYTEVKVGNFKGKTKLFEKNQNPQWNEVFAFAKDNLQSNVLEVVVKDKDLVKDDFVGRVRFDLNEVPLRIPPDSPLAPEWYRLEDKDGNKNRAEIMLAVWYGTQADEAFPDACYSDAFSQDRSSFVASSVRSKVYHSPRLWYVRVNVIEAQDLIAVDRRRFPIARAKFQLGTQLWYTKPIQTQTRNPRWNEELMLVVSEPFEDDLIVSVEDNVAPNRFETIGTVIIRIGAVERRTDDRVIRSQWFDLEKSVSAAMDNNNGDGKDQHKRKFRSRLNLSICLDGGYHVFDEPTYYSSDLRPTAKQLWKSQIGALELGILEISGLHPMKTRNERGTSDPYCVAKYGHKWVRTRTVVASLSPKFNEQYTWEVYDTATVLTVGVFDNNQINGSNGINSRNKDGTIGKVRIRLSTLETGRIYTHSYPLLALGPSGIKKTGELHLAIRFSCTSTTNLILQYSKPLLPKMHYKKLLPIYQQERLRTAAVQIVAARLSRAEPPLRKEVVEYMSDAHSHKWSMRKSRANFNRITSVFAGLVSAGKWLREVSAWKKPVVTVLVHIIFVILVFQPETILPNFFVFLFILGLWKYRVRPRKPPHMDTRLSCADSVAQDELMEEFDTFPTAQAPDIVRLRYDRLRIIGSRVQKVVGDIAAQGERIEALLSWRDPRATALFMTFCLTAATVLYAVPFQLIVLFTGFYFMRHPRFRHRTPQGPINFFRRLPARTDCML